jgi:DNA-binding GntR family transcriptional regulator
MAETKNKYGKASLKQQYHAIILERIVHCTYNSYDIITINSLVSEFDISKTPIREALLELCDEGLLKSIPKFGYEVVPFHEDQVKQIFNFRRLLEISAMDSYWNMLSTETSVVKLNSLIDKCESTIGICDPLERWKQTAKFHLTLASFYENEYLFTQLERCIRLLGIAYARSNWIHLNPINSHLGEVCHRDIVQHIEKNEKSAAIAALNRDMDNYMKITFNR